jgi:peroxiredoxin
MPGIGCNDIDVRIALDFADTEQQRSLLMARTNSMMLALGTPAPNFSLPDVVSGKMVSLADFNKSPALLVMFICNHCPYVKHVQAGMTQMAKDFQARGVGVAAISSNDVQNYPDDGPDKMKQEAQRAGYTFPYLYDESQDVARAYRAACTPDFFLFDGNHRLVYRGQMDDARRGNDLPVTGRSLRDAVDAILAGGAISPAQVPSIGCNIKWKPGRGPDYFKVAP